jgi:hypothetical protein
MSQTTVQESNTVRIGSAKVEVGEDIASLVDIGAIRTAEIGVTYDSVKVESGNAGVILDYKKNMRAAAKFDMFEVNLERIHEMSGGMTALTIGAGTPGVPATPANDQIVGPNFTALRIYDLELQNADGTVPTLTSVTADSSGVLAADDDYFLVKQANGRWGIYFDTTGTATVAETETITIVWGSLTQAASDTLTMGDSQVEITPRVVRFTNTDTDNKVFRITVYYAANEAGLTFPFPDDTADDPMILPVEMVGTIDPSRASKDQLLEVYDEQRYA